MARITPPEGGISVFDYNPELWEKFNEFYGYLWTHGALDQATKESARLRNALGLVQRELVKAGL